MGFFDDVTGQAISIVKFEVSDDTMVHQINRKLCVAFLVAICVLVCGRQYVGEPIACFCPATFDKFQVAYTNSYCWIRNNYAVPFSDILPVSDEDREQREISYYQWVPLILILLAAMFYFPRLFWKGLNGSSGINVKKIIVLVDQATFMSPKNRVQRLADVTSYIDKWIDIRDGKSSTYRRMRKFRETLQDRGFHTGNYISVIYVVTCALYTVNSLGQILLIDAILGNDFLSLGPDFAVGITTNRKWEDLRRFPRVAFCDMDIRQLQNVQRWTIQCSLPINLFNEKVFIMLWFLLVTMSVVNGVYLVFNIVALIVPKGKNNYIRKFLDYTTLSNQIRNSAKLPDVESMFVDLYLKQDGVFLLWLISQSTSQVVGSEVIHTLWRAFCKKPYIQTYLFNIEV